MSDSAWRRGYEAGRADALEQIVEVGDGYRPWLEKAAAPSRIARQALNGDTT